MNNCTNCEHAVFDEIWCEYKCKARCTRIYILLNSSECPSFKFERRKNYEQTQLSDGPGYE